MVPYLGERCAAMVALCQFLKSVQWGTPSGTVGRVMRSKPLAGGSRQLIGAQPDEIVFTGGGSEASNHAIKGTSFGVPLHDVHIVISAVEHPATANRVE